MRRVERGTVRVIDSASGCPEISLVEGEGNAKVVVWPGNGAECRTFQMISLGDRAQTVRLRHPSDCVYYVVAGSGCVLGEEVEGEARLVEGSMVHIDAGDTYRFRADSGGLTLLGGPCPADASLYSSIARAGS